MNPLTRVLAAVDFSEPARAAFEHALALCQANDAELSLVHAVPKDRTFQSRSRERNAMIAGLRQRAEAAGVRFKASVQHGDPAGVILLHARARRPDLIVLGTHQRAGFDRLRHGSVAETVSRRATQPVLIVPASDRNKTAISVPSFDSIVVAVDFSAPSISAVEKALSWANANGRVTLVHAVPGIPLASASRYTYHLSEPEYQRLLVRDAWRRLQDILSAEARAERNVHARVVIGDPSTEVVRVATDVDADLILVGVSSRGVIGRHIFGSTVARVIRTAGRPVLAIPELTVQETVPVSEEDQLAVAA